MYRDTIQVHTTRGRGTYPITMEVRKAVAAAEVDEGMVNVFVRHTSASLLINENADPDVQRDLDAFLARLVPDGDSLYLHTAEGEDDMPAHVRVALTATSLSVPVAGGAPMLGTWQGIFLWEHRTQPHNRHIVITVT